MYNAFEKNANNILNEEGGEILNKFAKTAQEMAPDSNLFGGPGVITNKYDGKKRYYPNIRTGFMGLVNVSVDKANDRIISYLDKLKEVKPWEDISGKGIISNIL